MCASGAEMVRIKKSSTYSTFISTFCPRIAVQIWTNTKMYNIDNREVAKPAITLHTQSGQHTHRASAATATVKGGI